MIQDLILTPEYSGAKTPHRSVNVKTIIGTFKTIAVLLCIFTFFCHSLSLELIEPRRWRLKRKRSHLLQFYSKLGLRILGIQVNEKGAANKTDYAHLLVGNHLSYIDILIIAASRPTLFVTSQEIRELPFLGALTILGGCLFVDRRTRQNLNFEISEIEEALRRGIHVTIFPEATSTNGSEVLRFRRPLFKAAILAHATMKPFCLNYRTIDEQVVNKINRDRICWYGDMQFLPHLWQLSQASNVSVDLNWLESSSPEMNRNESEMSLRAHEAVSLAFNPF